MNVTPEYKKYIEDCRAAGMTDVQIRSALLQAGWSGVQVSDLFNSFNNINNPTPVVPPVLQKQILEKPETMVSDHVESHVELEKRPEITPQVEPQQLRPHIHHPEHGLAQQSSPSQSSAGVASYQTGSQLNTPLQNESIVRENKFTPNDTAPQVQQPYSRMANPGAAPANSPYTMQANVMPGLTGSDAVIKEMKPGTQKAGGSIIKKVFFSVLILAFLLGSTAYGYMQFIDPFIIESDEVTLAKATNNLMEFKGAKAFDLIFNAEYKNQQAVSFAVDTVVDNSNTEELAMSARIYNIKINPELKDVQFFLDEEMLRQIEMFDLRFLALDNYGYMYPGIITSFIPMVEGLEELLFEKWIRFDIDEAEMRVEEFAGVESDNVSLPPYSITESVTKDKNKHITLQVDANSFKDEIIGDGVITIEEDRLLPPIIVKLVINAHREIIQSEVVYNDEESEISSLMTLNMRTLEAGNAIVAPDEDEIVDMQIVENFLTQTFSEAFGVFTEDGSEIESDVVSETSPTEDQGL